jgi:hypothetical protein
VNLIRPQQAKNFDVRVPVLVSVNFTAKLNPTSYCDEEQRGNDDLFHSSDHTKIWYISV